MNVDPTGHSFWLFLAAAILLFTPVGGAVVQAAVSVVSYAVMSLWAFGDLIFNGGNGAWQDMCNINWNPFNTSEQTVVNSSVVSFYKGVPVFITNNPNGSISLGAIGLSKTAHWNIPLDEILKHEHGHNTQLVGLGLLSYLLKIGIPSIWKNGDNTPWELGASILGDSSYFIKASTQEQQKAAKDYFLFSIISHPMTWIYNFLAFLNA